MSAESAIKIQTFFRSHYQSSQFHNQLRNELDKKISDIKKLSSILKNTKNIDISPPGEVCLRLLRLLCFGKFSHTEVFIKSPPYY